MNVETLWNVLTRPLSDEAIETFIKTYSGFINFKLKSGDSFLHSAIAGNHQKLALALIKCPNVERNEFSDVSSLTPVSLSVDLNQPDVAMALIQSGADLKKANALTRKLHKIVDQDKRKLVESLYDKTLKLQESSKITDKTVTANQLYSLLTYCLHDSAAMELIVNAHKDILNDKIPSFTNILFWAACKNNTTLCKILIAAGADINHKSTEGESVLSIAIKNSSFDCAEQFILAGIDVFCVGKEGNTALDWVKMNFAAPKALHIRELLESKMIKPVVAQSEQKPESEEKATITKPEETPKVDISVGLKVIKFMRDNNIDHTFNNNQITAASNDKVIEFALANGVPYKTSNGQTIITLA